jgi:hypothetical protein
VRISLPAILSRHEGHFNDFVEGMIFKLHVNAFKDDLVIKDVPKLIAGMMDELTEFRDQLALEQDDPNTLAELVDMGNFVYLLFALMRNRGVMDERERFIKEFFTIRPDEGKVYAAKNRSGSRYRQGEEIKGTVRGGRVYLRTQHAISGAYISMPRACIVWWAAWGVWPTGDLRYLNGDTMDDRIDNLALSETRSKAEFPFVSQWKPAGKEDTPNYGKWTYQRRFHHQLVKCGYYDTQEEAAELGLKAWKEKTRCLSEKSAA